jgi:sigma-E factor negative regulatory protein RseB
MVMAVWGQAFGVESTAPDAKAWLAAARQAMAKSDYRGTIAYLKDNRVESLQVVHGNFNGVEQERILSVNSPMREVIRNAGKVTCYFPESHSMSVEDKPTRDSFLLEIPNDLGALSNGYDFKLGKNEHVAQRLAQQVWILPRDDFRYGRRLWIDVESKLPLKYELVDENDEVLEQMVFTSINLDKDIPPRELEPVTKIDSSWKVKQHENLPADSLAWTLDGVPEGFRMVSYSRLKRGPDNRAIDHILLSDGFSSVSVYIDQLMTDFFTAQPRKVGAINSYTRKLDEFLVTAMGEVPLKTVQSIGNGIHRQESRRP